MIRFLFSLFLLATPAYAQQGQVVGPYPTAIGTASIPLSAALGGTGNTGGAFTAYVPTAVCSQTTGTVVCTATGRWQQVGKRVDLTITVAVTGTFTVGIFTSVSLPVTSANVSATWEFAAKENATTGIGWVGLVNLNSAVMNGSSVSNNPAITTGSSITFTGWYEAQ